MSGFPSVRLIAEVVAEHQGLTYPELISDRRAQPLVRARAIAAGLARRLTTRSTPVIGRALGGRDHTTVLHALGRFDAELQSNADFAREVSDIEETIAVVSAACQRLKVEAPADADTVEPDAIARRVMEAGGLIALAPEELVALAGAIVPPPLVEEVHADAARELIAALDAADAANFADRGGIINARKRVASARAALALVLDPDRKEQPQQRKAVP